MRGFFAAINDFQEVTKQDNENRRAHEGLERARKLQKQAQRKDYYKILGVKRYIQSSRWFLFCILGEISARCYRIHISPLFYGESLFSMRYMKANDMLGAEKWQAKR